MLDGIFILIMFYACVKGLKKGFIQSVFAFFAFFIALAAALKLSAVVANRLSGSTHFDAKWMPFLSFVLVLALVYFLISLAGKILQKTAETVMLGWINKISGAVFYMLLYGLFFSTVIFYAKQMNLITEETINKSVFYPYVSPLAPEMMKITGNIIPFFKDVFSQLERFFEEVSNNLNH